MISCVQEYFIHGIIEPASVNLHRRTLIDHTNQDEASVCLPGYGFFENEEPDYEEITTADRNNWSSRVPLANLSTDSYSG